MCFSSIDCATGEVCANTAITTSAVCVSSKQERDLTSLRGVASTVKNTEGFTLDPCRSDSECQSGRKCRKVSENLPPCEGSQCVCLPPRIGCFSSAECVEQEVCANTSSFQGNFCISVKARAALEDISTITKPIVCRVQIEEDPPMRERSKRRLRRVRIREAVEMDGEIAIRRSSEPVVSTRIVGGRPASSNLVKYMVHILDRKGRSICTGTLLSARWVLTAGHCQIYTGYIASFDPRKSFTRIKDIRIVQTVTHPEYVVSSDDFLNDITLCELAEDAPEGSLFMKVNAKTSTPKDDSLVRAVGYGLITAGNEGGFILRQVDFRSVTHSSCSKQYATMTTFGIDVVKKLQVCAGSARGGCGTW